MGRRAGARIQAFGLPAQGEPPGVLLVQLQREVSQFWEETQIWED